MGLTVPIKDVEIFDNKIIWENKECSKRNFLFLTTESFLRKVLITNFNFCLKNSEEVFGSFIEGEK